MNWESLGAILQVDYYSFRNIKMGQIMAAQILIQVYTINLAPFFLAPYRHHLFLFSILSHH